MKLRPSLSAKILGAAFLNVFLLGAAFAAYTAVQFRLNPNSLLLAPGQSRILAVSRLLALDLQETPHAGWDALLLRYGQAHSVTFALFDEDETQLAGPPLAVPPGMLGQVNRDRPRRPDRGAERDSVETKSDRRPPRGGPGAVLVTTRAPRRYWIGVRVPVRTDPSEEPRPGSLVLQSSSYLFNPLLFNLTPLLGVIAVVILVSAACWLPLLRGMTQSISQLTRTAGQIAEGRFDARADLRRNDEIGALGEAINRMALRLSGFVTGQKRFLGDIAHELCSPIANIQMAVGILDRPSTENRDAYVADIREEVEHMSALVNELLSFTKADLHSREVRLAPVNVAAAVRRAVQREAGLESRIETSIDEQVEVLAEPDLLIRALANLLRNAVRYAGAAGPITVSARREGGSVSVTVADEGPGVPEASLDDLFAPFYRVDPSRNQETGGVGLGLAIVKTCVEACRGTVRCRNRQPSGLEVEIRLPGVTK